MTAGREASAARQRRLRQRMLAAGFATRSATRQNKTSEIPPSTRLSEVLRDLGPLYIAFGSYLANRPDLAPLGSCLALRGVENGLQPTPTDEIRRVLRSAGGPLRELRQSISESPIGVSSTYQWHRIDLGGDGQGVVKIVRPEFEHQASSDTDALAVFEEFVLWDDPRRPIDISCALSEFRSGLGRCLNLNEQAQDLSDASEWVSPSDELELRPDIARLRSARVVVSDLPNEDFVGDRLSHDSLGDHSDLGRCLATAWLHLALIDGVCFEHIDPWDIVVQPNGGFAFLGGLASLPDRRSRNDLLRYLTASAQHEPDRACAFLVRLSEATEGRRSQDYLRIQLRQATPFRDGSWSEPIRGERLAHTLLLHWRLARSNGYAPSRALAAFEHGVSGMAHLSEALAPTDDAFEQAVADTRVVAAAVDVRKRLGPTTLLRFVRRLLGSLDHLAHNSDELIRRVEASESSDSDEAVSQHSIRWKPLVAILVAALTSAWALRVVSSGQGAGAWIEPTTTVVLLILVIAYILVVERSRTRPG
ncbi:MAG: hypothetical protein GY906_15105 [bacterium]|nr:hypothetical protein [bacterium]